MKYKVDPNKIWVVDVETDNKNNENRAFSASPYYENNRVVNQCIYEVTVDAETGDETLHRKIEHRYGKGPVINEIDNIYVPDDEGDAPFEKLPWAFCGHNVRFDWAYWRKEFETRYTRLDIPISTALRNGDTVLWDTQFVEYLLSGHQKKMPSLNDLAQQYGVESKREEVADFWKSGIQTEDIDQDTLNEYVEQDVKITKDIALQQMVRAYEEGMFNFLLVQLRALYILHEYEYNGLHVDSDVLDYLTERYETQASACKDAALFKIKQYTARCANNYSGLYHFVTNYVGGGNESQFYKDNVDIDSADKIKKLIFGGTMEFKHQIRDGYYKSGKKKGEVKYKNAKVEVEYPSQIDPNVIPYAYLTPKGKEAVAKGDTITYKEVSLDDNAIEHINSILDNELLINLLNNIRDYRDYNKVANTYCKGIKEYLFNYDSCIHANYNVDLSATGRLTSSNPNLQNQPSSDDSDFKSIFTSRFANGAIGVVDFKQLEVVGLAYSSGDKELIDDLEEERDVHEETAKEAGLQDPFTGIVSGDDRRMVKGINFGTIYGAGVDRLAQQSKLDPKLVRRCIDALKSRYPIAFGRDYINSIRCYLNDTAQNAGRNEEGIMLKGSYLVQPTGRKIWLQQEPSKFADDGFDWPYTKMRNYPVQSLAYDIVCVARILFFEEIIKRGLYDKILMVNEVHDEIVFDMQENYDTAFREIVEEVEHKLGEELTNRYNLWDEFSLPLRIEHGVGDSWKTAK